MTMSGATVRVLKLSPDQDPTNPNHVAEAAYWHFDSLKKTKLMTDRDAFKAACQLAIQTREEAISRIRT